MAHVAGHHQLFPSGIVKLGRGPAGLPAVHTAVGCDNLLQPDAFDGFNRIGRNRVLALMESLFRTGEIFQHTRADPRLDVGSAVRGIDEADGDPQVLMQGAAEEITAGREQREGLFRAHRPAAGFRLEGIGLLGVEGADDVQQADVRVVVGLGQLLLIAVHAPPSVDGHLHVGLAAAEPDIATKDVLQHLDVLFLTGIEPQAVGAAGTGRGDRYGPFSVLSGQGLVGLAVPGSSHLDGFAGIGPAPDGDLGVARKNHVVCKQGAEAHLGSGYYGKSQRKSTGNQNFSHSNKDLAMPISKPRSSARPRRRPMQEYPGLVFFLRSSIIW